MAPERQEEWRKPLEPPLRNGVGWANILARDAMVATYNGKVIVVINAPGSTPITYSRPQSYVDEIIAADKKWQDISIEVPSGPPLDILVYDDGTPVNEYVLSSEVPGDAESLIVLEPAFYIP